MNCQLSALFTFIVSVETDVAPLASSKIYIIQSDLTPASSHKIPGRGIYLSILLAGDYRLLFISYVLVALVCALVLRKKCLFFVNPEEQGKQLSLLPWNNKECWLIKREMK